MIRRTLALSLVTALVAAAACDQSVPSAKPCRDIPANGCLHLPDGAECSDPTCAASYTCTDGAWTFAQSCPAFDGGPRNTTADATTPVPGDAGQAGQPDCLDASEIDAPPGAGGGPGCIALIAPDCPLSRALSCDLAATDPCGECDTFFVCQAGGWFPWGGCSPDGSVVLKN